MKNALDHAIREYEPTDGSFLELEQLLEDAFQEPDPKEYDDAIFNLFERFPEDDGAGVFWSALHGMESVGHYEVKLRQYFRRWPNMMNKIMLDRLSRSEDTNPKPTTKNGESGRREILTPAPHTTGHTDLTPSMQGGWRV